MKYLLIAVCLVVQVQASVEFPKSPFDAIKVGLETKIATATNPADREKYQAELTIVNKKIERFRSKWLEFKAQQQLVTKG